jgi:L-lactate dehydrogenase
MIDRVCDDIVLMDTNKERVWAHVRDLRHAQSYLNHKAAIYEGGFSDCADADIVIITASPPYKAGMRRTDLLRQSGAVMKETVPMIMESGFNGVIVVLTNPVDAIAYYVWKLSGLPATSVIGTGTYIDTIRAIHHMALRLDIEPHEITAFCIGEHAEKKFIPRGSVTIKGVCAKHHHFNSHMDTTAFLSDIASDIETETERIVLGKGSTQYGVTASLMGIIKALLYDVRMLTPVSVFPEGNGNMNDIYISLPAVIGAGGIKNVSVPDLSDQEEKFLIQAAGNIRRCIDQLL